MSDPTPCACGSGLRALRCCALDPATLPPPGSARLLRSAIERMRQAFRHDSRAVAEELALGVLELAPAQPAALDVLWRLRAADRPTAAEAVLRRLVALHPNDAAQTCELGLMLLRKPDLPGAEAQARNALRIAPTEAPAHNLMAMVFAETHRPHPAEFHYRRVLALTGRRDPIVLANLAWALKGQGRAAEARALYEESTDAAPDVVLSWLGWARLEEAEHALDRAGALLDRAEALAPDHAGVRLTRAVLLGRAGDHAGAVAALAADPDPEPDALLEQGRRLDALDRPADAFAAWERGKALARARGVLTYRAAEAEAMASRLGGFFTAARLAATPRAGVRDDVAQPVFVLGFPRSGTTLVEQILASHPRIAAGDELPLVAETLAALPRLLDSPVSYPEALAELWQADRRDALDELRDRYLAGARRLGAVRDGAPWFTDKMPLNETHLGLIALLFPAAPLVHVLRHPLDAVLSAFSHHLTHGFGCAAGLESTARHYVLVMDLVRQYRSEMALRYLPLRYEDLVAQPEAETRRLLGFVGEAFDPACLAPHANPRRARTPSHAQVARPIHGGARFRYRRYLDQLRPVLPILAPTIERLGYAIEE